MEIGKPEMKEKLEIANSLTFYHLNINVINVVIAQAIKGMFNVTRPTLSKIPDCTLFSPIFKHIFKKQNKTDNLAPKVRNV